MRGTIKPIEKLKVTVKTVSVPDADYRIDTALDLILSAACNSEQTKGRTSENIPRARRYR